MSAEEQREPAPSGETNGTGGNGINNAIVRSDGPVQEALKPKLDEAVAYLRWWRPAGPWILTSINNDRKNHDTTTETFRLGEEDRMAAWIAKQNDELGRNVYYHVNSAMRLLSKKAEKTDMASMDWIHVDIDPRPGKDIDEEQARILAMLGAHEGLPAPSAVVFSGGGYQAFWRLRDGLPINGDLTKAEDAERFNLQVELLMGADACHNCDRIMRLPGTVNHPSDKKKAKGQKPALAHVLEQHDDRVYPASAFTKAPQRQDDLPDAGGGTAATRVKVSGNVRRVALDELPVELNDRIKVIIQQGKDDDQPLTGKDQSRSAWLLHAVGAMVRTKKIDDDTIYAIITDPDYKISASVLDKGNSHQIHRYATRQIKRAKEEAIAPELVEFNDQYALVESVGGRARVMREFFDYALKQKDIEFLLVDGFKVTHCNRFVMVSAGKDANGNEKQRPVELGEWWLQHPERRSFRSVTFVPGAELPPSVLNLWRGFAFDAIPGDCSLYLEHLRKNVCRNNDEHYQYLLRCMAYGVQNPGEPGHVAVVCRGKKGTGKNQAAEHYGKLFGRHHKVVTNPEHLMGKFNATVGDAVVIVADECFVANNKAHEAALKALITNERVAVEMKGVDAQQRRNCVHLWMLTNDEWAVPASDDERRYFVLDVGDDNRRDTEYFAAIAKQMEDGGYAALLHHLLTMDLTGFDVRRVPETDALRDQKRLSRRGVEGLWFEALCTGELPVGTPRAGGGVDLPSSELLRAWERRLGKATGMRNELAALLSKPQGNHRGKGMGFDKKKSAPRGYCLPPLAECRKRWDELRGPEQWDDAQCWAVIRENDRGASCIVPPDAEQPSEPDGPF